MEIGDGDGAPAHISSLGPPSYPCKDKVQIAMRLESTYQREFREVEQREFRELSSITFVDSATSRLTISPKQCASWC